MNFAHRIPCFAILLALSMGSELAADDSAAFERGMRLGSMKAFAEMVGVGVKNLGLSSTLSTEEFKDLIGDARAITDQFGVLLYKEDDLLVTDLFPHDVAVGKIVLLIYKGDSLEKYLALKSRKANLIEQRAFDATAREALARDFGRLLSYPDEGIDELLARQSH